MALRRSKLMAHSPKQNVDTSSGDDQISLAETNNPTVTPLRTTHHNFIDDVSTTFENDQITLTETKNPTATSLRTTHQGFIEDAGTTSGSDQIALAEKRDRATMPSGRRDEALIDPQLPSDIVNSSSDTTNNLSRRRKKLRPSGFGNDSAPKPVPSQRPLLSVIYYDIRRLPRAAYPCWKWPLLTYLVWMLSTWAFVAVYTTIIDQIQPICATPWLGQRLPWCTSAPPPKGVSLATFSETQEQLEGLVNSMTHGVALRMDIVSSEFAVRALNVRVQYSALKRKDDLSLAMDALADGMEKIVE
jgi:hypothetical protein